MRFWRKREIETKTATLFSPDADLLAIFGITSSGTVAVSAADALCVPAVNCCIRAISEAAATLERHVLVRGADGVEKRDDAHPVAHLLRSDANPWSSSFEFVRDLVAQSLTQDAGGLVWVNRVGGRPAELIQYRNGVLQVALADTGEPTFTINGGRVDSADVIYLRNPFDRCPLSLAREAIGVAHYMERHAGRLFKNGARPGGTIEMPKGVGEDAIKKMRSGWRAAFEGAENAGKTPILFDGAVFKAQTLASTDAQFLELRKFQVTEICRAFRIPPSMAFELDRVTWSNGEQMGKEFLTYCLEPHLQALEGALGRALLTEDERKTHRIRFDRDDLTRASLTERATAINSLRASEVINANEGRDWLDMPPRSGGEEFKNPNITAGKPPTEPA